MVAFLLLTALPTAAADDTFGPLRVAERNPLYGLFLTPRLEAAAPLEAGRWRLELGSSFSNIFERAGNDAYYEMIDLEWYAASFSLSHGLNERWELGCDWLLNTTFAGSLDGSIQDFHHFFGLPNDTRDEVEDGSYTYYLSSVDGILRNIPEKQQHRPGDATLFAKYRLRSAASGKAALGLRLALKLPVGDDAFSSGETDLAIGLLASGRHRADAWYVSADLVALSPPDELEPIMNRAALIVAAAYERRWRRSLSWLVQLDGGTPYFKGTGLTTLDDIPLNLTLGLAGRMPTGPDWQISFAEDIYGDGPSVDFTLDLRLAWRF